MYYLRNPFKNPADIFPKDMPQRLYTNFTCKGKVDFTPLLDPCLGYTQQDHIDPYCVEMASAAMIHFGLDPGKFVRFLFGKYTSQHRDVCCTLDAIQDHVTSDKYGHIKQILLNGCPAQLTFEVPLSNKLELISCGNFKVFVENPQLVQ